MGGGPEESHGPTMKSLTRSWTLSRKEEIDIKGF